MAKDNKKSEIERLNAEIKRLKKELKKRKKYGLVWEPKDEEVIEMCKEKLPVLKEVKNKIFVAGVIRRVNIDDINFFRVRIIQNWKGVIIVAFN